MKSASPHDLAMTTLTARSTARPPALPHARTAGLEGRQRHPPGPAMLSLIVLMWVAWAGVSVVADFLGFMMLAFADAPGAGQAVRWMIFPLFAWFAIAFGAGTALLIHRGGWQIPLAFALAISPPFLVFAGYNLLM